MAKNELVSLALIYSKPIHGYAINSIIKNMGLEHWAKISAASLYNTLARLVKQDCVTVVKEKVGKMPARKVYTITELTASSLTYEDDYGRSKSFTKQ